MLTIVLGPSLPLHAAGTNFNFSQLHIHHCLYQHLSLPHFFTQLLHCIVDTFCHHNRHLQLSSFSLIACFSNTTTVIIVITLNLLVIASFRHHHQQLYDYQTSLLPLLSQASETCINLLKPTGHVMHQQFNIQQLYVLTTLYLCVLYLSENKQRLVPLTG